MGIGLKKISKTVNKRLISKFTLLGILVVISYFLARSYFKLVTPQYLTFSDGAKVADVARNLHEGKGYGSSFNFFGSAIFETIKNYPFPAKGVHPAMPYSTAVFYKIFGVSDFSVIATSFFFYLLLVLAVFFLGKKLYGNLVGVLASLAVLVNINFLDYATSGASEILFAFEIVSATYLIISRKKWLTIFSALILVAMYFTRPQAFIFIAGFILLWFLLRFKPKKALFNFLFLILLGILVDRLILVPLSGKFFLYSITSRGSHAVTQHLPGVAVSESLRGVAQDANLLTVFKKVFYNLYNFYKLLPQIASPYMWALFVIGLFKWGKDKTKNSLKIVTIFMVVATFLVTALTIPFFRYIHPVIPLVYLFATATLVWIVGKMVKKRLVTIVSTLLITFFVVGQILGIIFLDSRFKADRTNRGKPPIYVKLSYILRDNTEPEDIVITNLDTWGSWYGERKTVWFPLEPSYIIPPEGESVPFDAIYLTSYLIDDENYHMGEEWRKIFQDPEYIEKTEIGKFFYFAETVNIDEEEVYEKKFYKAVLFLRK